MALKKSTRDNHWEVSWYGNRAAVMLITVQQRPDSRPFEIPYRIYLAALNSQCEHCGDINDSVFLRHQNTAYVDSWKNWHCLCAECQKEADADWQDLWDDYYSSRL